MKRFRICEDRIKDEVYTRMGIQRMRLESKLYDARCETRAVSERLDNLMKHLGLKEVEHPPKTTIEADE